MPMPAVGGVASTLSHILSSWQLSFTSVHFLLFLPLALGGCFALPGRWRPAALLFFSYFFYFFAAPRYLPVLLFGTLLSFFCGRLVAGRKSAKGRRAATAGSVALLLMMLCFFKYNAFFAGFLSPLFGALNLSYDTGFFTTAGALGISFYTFTAIGYLVDVQRGDAPAEKNLLYYALFLGFFPTVTMGPIARAGNLLPQLRALAHTRFEAARVADGLRRMAVGAFKKLAVADLLAIFTGQIYGDLAAYSGLTLSFAAVCFALQLYFDFSGYSDIAIGAAQLFGIRLPENFQTPYFSTNFSAFWQRWHISLSSWLQDTIFTPLVWSRWTQRLPVLGRFAKKPPVLSAILAVFLVSGIWHGDTLCFLVWGALQAAFRMGEEGLHRTLGKPRKNPSFPVRVGKTAVVLVLWAESLVFFEVGMTANLGVGDAWVALGRQFTGFSLAQTAADISGAVWRGFFPNALLVQLFLLFCGVCVAVALWADWAQCFKLNGAPLSDGLARLRTAPRWVCTYGLVLACFAGMLIQSGGFGGVNFLYGGF